MSSSHLVPDAATPSDPELIAAVRAGDSDAYGQLFERHHAAALSLARQIAGPSDADDLVSEAFMKVHRVLAGGGGPDVAFRAYLLTAVRRLHVDRLRAAKRVTPSDDLEQYDAGTPFQDPAVDNFENAAAAKAFASLPERWQLVLWHLEVEGQKPAEIAPLLGMSANSVSALAYRAREGLRQAYLQMHLADTAAEECRWVTERLGAHVRKGLSKRDAAKVDEHLDECPRCAAVYLELTEVNNNLSAILAPALLGTAAAGYLATTSGGVSMGGLGLTALALRARHFVHAHSVLTAGGVAGTVVAASVATVFVTQAFTGGGQQTEPVADPPGVQLPDPGGGPTAPTGPGDRGEKGDRRDDRGDRRDDRAPGNRATPPPAGFAPPIPATTPADVAPTPPPPAEQPPVVSGGGAPNPQDDDPPAPSNDDDPGLPPVTVPPPPPPPPVDLSLAIDVTSLGSSAYLIVLDATTAEPATSLSMTIQAPEFTTLSPSGWSCTPGTTPGEALTCTATSANPPALSLNAVYGRGVTPALSATLSAVGYDEDPDLGNNSVSWTGQPAPE